MSNKNSFYCHSCQQRSSLEMRVRKPQENGDPYLYEIAECNGLGCKQHYLVMRLPGEGSIIEIYPNTLPKPVGEEIPAAIATDLVEAYKCLSAGAYRASVVMARRCLQGIAIAQGAPKTVTRTKKSGEEYEAKNDLNNQISWLFKEGIITKALRDWAHEVRSVGNDGAHPADAEDQYEVTRSDAEDIINLVESFSQTLYIAPAIYRRRHANLTDEQEGEQAARVT